MRVLAVALVVSTLAAAPAAAEVVVRVSGSQVELTASAAPLAEVLDRLARQTGMKVVYEGASPRQLVTVSLHGRTLTETLLAVFEGLGVNFALVADASGERVQTLVIAGTATATASPSSGGNARPAAATARRPFGPPPGASPETVDPAFEEADEEPVGDEEPFAGLPAGPEITDPGGVPNQPPDPTLPNPATGQAPPVPTPGAQVPPQVTSPFSASPFMPPQPQPFPPPAPAVPTAPPANPPTDENTAPANPPPP